MFACAQYTHMCILYAKCIQYMYIYIYKWKSISISLTIFLCHVYVIGPVLVISMKTALPPLKCDQIVLKDGQCSETWKNNFPNLCDFYFLRNGRFCSQHF